MPGDSPNRPLSRPRQIRWFQQSIPLCKHLPLSLSDQLHLDRLARDKGSPIADSKGGRSLLLVGMIRTADEPPLAEEVAEGNQTKLTALRGLFERLTGALTELSAIIEKKLHPPEVKDRVKVDIERRVLTVDGLDYNLNTGEQARVLAQMAQANGTSLPGPEIVKKAGLRKGFKVDRALEQIMNKHEAVRRFIPPASNADNKFCFRLPQRP